MSNSNKITGSLAGQLRNKIFFSALQVTTAYIEHGNTESMPPKTQDEVAASLEEIKNSSTDYFVLLAKLKEIPEGLSTPNSIVSIAIDIASHEPGSNKRIGTYRAVGSAEKRINTTLTEALEAAFEASRDSASTKIQGVYRGHQGRKIANHLKEERANQDSASTKIQRVFRGYQGREAASHLKEERDSAPTIQRIVRGKQGRKIASNLKEERAKRDSASTKIQRVFRDHQQARQDSAPTIQRIVRGKQGRNTASHLKKERRAAELKKNSIKGLVNIIEYQLKDTKGLKSTLLELVKESKETVNTVLDSKDKNDQTLLSRIIQQNPEALAAAWSEEPQALKVPYLEMIEQEFTNLSNEYKGSKNLTHIAKKKVCDSILFRLKNLIAADRSGVDTKDMVTDLTEKLNTVHRDIFVCQARVGTAIKKLSSTMHNIAKTTTTRVSIFNSAQDGSGKATEPEQRQRPGQ